MDDYGNMSEMEEETYNILLDKLQTEVKSGGSNVRFWIEQISDFLKAIGYTDQIDWSDSQ